MKQANRVIDQVPIVAHLAPLCLPQAVCDEQPLGRLALWVVQRLERLQCTACSIVAHQVTPADCIPARIMRVFITLWSTVLGQQF